MKKRSAFTLVELLVMIAVGCVLIAIMIWATLGFGPGTNVGMIATLRTIEHDGHKFVAITKSGGGAGVIHHPGCQCLQVNSVEVER